MTTKFVELDRDEKDLLVGAMPDEALELAAGATKEKAGFTLGACTGLSVCPS